jgi:hypothetical protein
MVCFLALDVFSIARNSSGVTRMRRNLFLASPLANGGLPAFLAFGISELLSALMI